jgi:hypothetical protein
LLHDEQYTDGNVASQLELYLQETLLLLCPELYKHPETTKLNLNTTKEKGDGNKLLLFSSLKNHHRRKRQRVAKPSSSSFSS